MRAWHRPANGRFTISACCIDETLPEKVLDKPGEMQIFYADCSIALEISSAENCALPGKSPDGKNNDGAQKDNVNKEIANRGK